MQQYEQCFNFPSFNYLVIWAKPNIPFVCIEPRLGIVEHDDTNGDFLKKDALICLPKGETFEAKYVIEIIEQENL